MSKGPEICAEINCSTGTIFANLFLLLSNNYPNYVIFHFPLIFACFDPRDPGRGNKAGYVLSAKDILIVRASLAHGKLRKKKYLHQPNAFNNLTQCFHYHL